ncbi:hypothetical protein FRC06_000675 [Ceratobasidium sp. 370]|nr:hypothetical protein FRC06_000675 [Ceratobasidium sp. 370]
MSTSINSLIASITKLDRSNFHDWAFDIEMIARRAGTWGVLSGEETWPDSDEKGKQAEWDKLDNNALTMIGLLVARSELMHIRGCTTAYGMWKALFGVYSRSSRVNRITLRQQLQSATLGADNSVQDYVTHIVDVTTHLWVLGVALSDEDEVDVLIMNLPDAWGHVASSLMIQPGDLGVKDVVGVLLEEETRRQHSDMRAAGVAAFAARMGGQKGQVTSGGSGDGNGGGQALSVDHRTCFRCGQRGHIVTNCLTLATPKPATESAKVAVMDMGGGIYHL